MSLTPAPFVKSGSRDRVYRSLGDEIRFHAVGAETGGTHTLFTVVTAPGGGPPPHRHARESETFHVLEGRVNFFLDGQWTEAGPGATVFMPAGSFHTFKNIGPGPSRMLVVAAPAGFEAFYAELSAECERPGGPDMGRILGISAAHGISYPQVPAGAGGGDLG